MVEHAGRDIDRGNARTPACQVAGTATLAAACIEHAQAGEGTDEAEEARNAENLVPDVTMGSETGGPGAGVAVPVAGDVVLVHLGGCPSKEHPLRASEHIRQERPKFCCTCLDEGARRRAEVGGAWRPALLARKDRPMLIAQISDLHFLPKGTLAFGRVDVAGCLERAIDHLNALQPRPDARADHRRSDQ